MKETADQEMLVIEILENQKFNASFYFSFKRIGSGSYDTLPSYLSSSILSSVLVTLERC